VLWWVLAGSLALAEDVDPFAEPDESELFRFDAQIVTVASRYAQTVRKAPNIVALIDSDQIRERGYRTLSDVLRDLPGVYVWRSEEGRDLVAMRGIVSADNNKMLLLVDGVPWYDGVYTHAFIDAYQSLANVKQVEVIKGPGSAVYGTNAIAGVINIVTRTGTDLDGVTARVVCSGWGGLEASVAGGGAERIGKTELIAAAHVRMLTQVGQGLDSTARGRRDIRGEDPRRAVNAGINLDLEGLSVQAHHVDYRHSYLTGEVDDVFDEVGADIDSFGLFYHDTHLEIRYERTFGRVTLTPAFWSHLYDNPGAYPIILGTDPLGMILVETDKRTRRLGSGLELRAIPAIDHVTVAGAGFEQTKVLLLRDLSFVDMEHTADPAEFRASPGSTLRNVYGFAQHTWTALPALELTAGARVDKRVPSNDTDEPQDEVFSVFVSPRAGILLVPSDAVTAKLLYGRAFRAPSVRETLVQAELEDGEYPFAAGSFNLYPERIDTAELEFSVSPSDALDVRVLGSYSHLGNEIDKVTPPNQYANLPGGLDVVGAEIELGAHGGPADARVAVGWTDARYGDSGPYAGRQQYEFPPFMVKGNLRLAASQRFSSTATVEAYSKRPRASWSPTAGVGDGDAVGLLHLSGRATRLGPDERLELTAGVRNVLDASWGTGVYRNDVDRMSGDEPRYPAEIGANGRELTVGIELKL
jgi:iron complex outermembrane receptor protein